MLLKLQKKIKINKELKYIKIKFEKIIIKLKYYGHILLSVGSTLEKDIMVGCVPFKRHKDRPKRM
jgi:hypothetical protein